MNPEQGIPEEKPAVFTPSKPPRPPADKSKTAGRWTKEEHQKFVEALRIYGKNWKKVEEHVGTRTGAQIRSHAQKFFNRLQREMGGEGTTTTMPGGVTSPVPSSLRKWSASSNSTNGFMSDDADNVKEEEAPTAVRKASDDRTVTNEMQSAMLVQMMQKMTLQNNSAKEKPSSYGSFYEVIMEKFRMCKKDTVNNLRLSDLVDMTSRHKNSETISNTAHSSSFQPLPAGRPRISSFSIFGRADLAEEEPNLMKRMKIENEY